MPLAGATEGRDPRSTVRLVCSTTPGEQDPVWLLVLTATGPPPETIKKLATPSLFQDCLSRKGQTQSSPIPHFIEGRPEDQVTQR